MKKIDIIYIVVILILTSLLVIFIRKTVVLTKTEIIVRDSPYDHIKEQNIQVLQSQVVLDVENVIWSRFADTHSMEPIIAKGANGLHLIPKSKEDVHVGDIVSYNPDIKGYEDRMLIHRAIQISDDNKGWYSIVKGDNLPNPDPGRIRFPQIKRILIGIIY